MSSSEYRIVMPSMSTGVFSSGAGGSGNRTCSHAPAARRSDLPASTPSNSTPPSSASAAAAVRNNPTSRDNPASTRIPARPSGTGIDRSLISALVGPRADVAVPRLIARGLFGRHVRRFGVLRRVGDGGGAVRLHNAPLLRIASLCIVAGRNHAPLLRIASLCIVAGRNHAPLLRIASLCIVAGAATADR